MPEFEHKNGGESVHFPPFAKFSSKNRKFFISTSENILYGTKAPVFFLEKWGSFGPFPIPNGEKMGKKWGSFLELYICIRQRADHRDQSL